MKESQSFHGSLRWVLPTETERAHDSRLQIFASRALLVITGAGRKLRNPIVGIEIGQYAPDLKKLGSAQNLETGFRNFYTQNLEMAVVVAEPLFRGSCTSFLTAPQKG